MSTKKFAIYIGSLLLAFAATHAKAAGTIDLTCNDQQHTCTATMSTDFPAARTPHQVDLTNASWTGKNVGAVQTSSSSEKSTVTYTCPTGHTRTIRDGADGSGYYDASITVTASLPREWTTSATVPVCVVY